MLKYMISISMRRQLRFSKCCWVFIIPAMLANAGLARAQTTTVEDQLHLTAADLEGFEKQAKDDVKDFGGHVEHIASKTYSIFLRKKYIGNALALFADPDENTIEVSVVGNTADVRSESIRAYLNNLLKLSYARVDITWYDFKITHFVKGADGNYYATATVFQKFSATNGNTEVKQSRRDLVKKEIQVELIKQEAYNGAQRFARWEIKLGDIKIVQKTLSL